MTHQPMLPISPDAEFVEGWKDGFPILVPQYGSGPIATFALDEEGDILGLTDAVGNVIPLAQELVPVPPLWKEAVGATQHLYVSPATGLQPGTMAAADKQYVDSLPYLLSQKQNLLVSATNIKTINGQSIIGSGDLAITVDAGVVAWTDVTDKPTEFTPAAHTQDINTITGLQTALDSKQPAGTYATGTGTASGTNTGDETTTTIKTKLGITTLSGNNTGDQVIPTTLPASDVSAWAKAAVKPSYTAAEVGAQVALVSGTNIRTVNGQTLLGSTDLVIAGAVSSVNGATGAVTISAGAQISSYTTSATWTKPASGSMVLVELWGAGGSGTAGFRGVVGNGLFGGGGGGGGARVEKLFALSDLPSSVNISIGAGGAAVAGVVLDGTKSAAGNAGGNTTFGSLLTAFGGACANFNMGSGGGGGGSQSAPDSGATWGGKPNLSANVGIYVSHNSTGGGNGGQGQSSPYTGTSSYSGGGGGGSNNADLTIAGAGGASVLGGGGGGSGGGINATSVRATGGAGGSQTPISGDGGAGGAVGAAGGNGAAFCGGGGGGAGTTTGGNGGTGGTASGGGGGGSSLNGNVSGGGGAGGNGFARVTVW